MKKKILRISLIVALISSCFIGCGKKEQTAEAEITESAEISEEASQETPSPTPEIADSEEEVEQTQSSKETDDNSNNGSGGIKEISDTPTKSATGEFTIDQAMEKLLAYLNARPVLVNELNPEDISCYLCAADELGGIEAADYSKMVTKDGHQMQHGTNDQDILDDNCIIQSSAACEWYYNWINNGEYMSTAEYITNHTRDEIINKYYKDIESGEKTIHDSYNTDDIVMLNAIIFAKYMDENKDSIVTGDVETAVTSETGLIKDIVGDTEIVYQLPIFVGPEKNELFILFDKDGNMVTIIPINDETFDKMWISSVNDFYR